MADVVVEHFDNSYAKVICEPSIAQELSDFFTFEVPGAQYSPQYRSKYWDGKIRLFNTKTAVLYSGLVNHIAEFCKLSDYSFKNNSQYFGTDIVSPDFIKTLGLKIEPRDYQKLAFSYAVSKKRTVIVSPTASGKSLIIYTIARYMQSIGKKRGLLIVPTVSLVEQMYSDFASYGWDVETNCQKIYQGMEKAPNQPLVISTWQSIFDMPKKYFSQFDYVIGDEAHTFKAKSLISIMSKLINCDYRIGTTGTLDGTKVNKLVLEGLFGPAKKIVSTKELIDQKHLAKFRIECLVLKHPEAVCKELKGRTYQDEIAYLIGSEPRNNFIKNLAINLNGNTLILYTYVEKHGKILFEMIKNSCYNRKVFFVSGETDVLDREQVRHITEKENDAIIVASYGTFSTGINIRNLHNIIFASPTKSRIRSLQSIGRGLRLGDNKEEAVLYDIADDLRYKTYTNFTLNHYEERVKMYSEERFPFKTRNIGLK
jgi:superfamily II DNA or RNA helicase